MIKSLYILNFQSHEKSKFDFVDGVNVIVGISDSGKTASFRALNWLSKNRPSGDSMRSTWGGDTNVIIETENGYVRRVRGKEDFYELKIHGRKSLVFKAFRTDVPKEIIDFLNLNELNLQSQLDAPFLLSDTPGGVAQFFNKIAKLEKIDLGISNVNSAIRNIEGEIKYKSAELLKQEQLLKDFDYLDDMEKDVKHLEKLNDVLEITVTDKANLQYLHKSIDNSIAGIEYYSEIISLEDDVLSIEKDMNAVAEIQTKQIKIKRLTESVKNLEEEIKSKEKLIKTEASVDNLLQLNSDLKIAVEQRKNLFKLFYVINESKVLLKKKVSEIASMEVVFEKEMGETCLLCGQPIKK